MAIGSLLIANRGEIAVRIIRAARDLSIRTVQVYSKADAQSLPVMLADEAVEIGPPQAAKSYLNTDAILTAAKDCGVDAIHPGYGFLAENADFADAVTEAGMIFCGPSGEVIRLLGDKVAARKVAAESGIPTVPGSDGRVDSLEEARSVIQEIGFPVLIKAAAGGGGRGIRIVGDWEEVDRFLPQAAIEAQSAFGDGGLYIEKLVKDARHIEVQVLGDGKDVIHCFERECSLQRRRQKVWEEAPAVTLPEGTRQALCESAVALARHVGYCGAGTLEFLYDEKADSFYFIEMNTRIQVEHPVTEFITGIDLLREMILIAGGEPLRVRQDEVRINGHAIECRINAEDPANDFMPFPGTVDRLSVPGGPGVRFDTMLFPGYSIPPFYDSLLGKLIVWDDDRSGALRRLQGALSELEIGGVKTTKTLHLALATDKTVQGARFHTKFLEQWLECETDELAKAKRFDI